MTARALMGRWVGLLLVVAGAPAGATTLGFDDVSTAIIDVIPDGYGGFDWTDANVINGALYVPPPPTPPGLPDPNGYENGTVSGNYVAWNFRQRVLRAALDTFDFNSVYLTAAWQDGLHVLIEGLLDGAVVYSLDVELTTSSPVFVDADFLGIDEITFTPSLPVIVDPIRLQQIAEGYGAQFAMDDFTFDDSGGGVPEPGTALLVALGMAGLGLALRRRV